MPTDRGRKCRPKAVQSAIALDMLEGVDLAFLALDEGARVTCANRMAAEFFGRPAGSLAGTSLHDLFEACLRQTGVFDKFYDRVSATGKPGELEVPVHNFRWALFRLYPQARGMTVVIEDVTHRHIREEPQRAALLTFNSLPEAVFLVYENGRIYYSNDAAGHVTGYAREELQALYASEVIPDLDPWVLEHNGGSAPGGARIESILWPKAGDAVPVEVCVSSQTLFRKTNYIVSVRDIAERKRAGDALRKLNDELERRVRERTADLLEVNDELKTEVEERKQAEKALRESKELYRALFDNTDEGFMLVEPVFDGTGNSDDYYVREINDAWERQTGLRAADLVGKRVREALPDVELAWPATFAEVARTGIARHFESYYAGAGRWYDLHAFPYRNGQVGVLFRDITERKQAGEALLASKQQAELYLDLMGHDINNMLQIAMGYVELFQEMEPATAREEVINKPIEVLERCAMLIKNVQKLQMLNGGAFRSTDVDVCATLKDVRQTFGSVPNKAVTLDLNGCGHCYVRANELLRDVFANLVSNAIKHTGNRAEIKMGLDLVDERGARYCQVFVEDDGPGIPDGFKAVIFNRLLRGTNESKGIGLGLYIVKTLVDSYGGRVWVEDRVPGDHGKGARFVVMLPVA